MPEAPAQTLLAFDYGTRRLGVAIGNTLTASARPLAVLTLRSADHAVSEATALIGQWRPDRLVVGRPLGGAGAGEPVAATARAERFARRLQGRSGLPVVLVDERYSSFEARSRMREERASGELGRAAGDDAHAALVILEQYLAERAASGRCAVDRPPATDDTR